MVLLFALKKKITCAVYDDVCDDVCDINSSVTTMMFNDVRFHVFDVLKIRLLVSDCHDR